MYNLKRHRNSTNRTICYVSELDFFWSSEFESFGAVGLPGIQKNQFFPNIQKMLISQNLIYVIFQKKLILRSFLFVIPINPLLSDVKDGDFDNENIEFSA